MYLSPTQTCPWFTRTPPVQSLGQPVHKRRPLMTQENASIATSFGGQAFSERRMKCPRQFLANVFISFCLILIPNAMPGTLLGLPVVEHVQEVVILQRHSIAQTMNHLQGTRLIIAPLSPRSRAPHTSEIHFSRDNLRART